MNNHKTTPSTDPSILELRARVAELEEEQTELANSHHFCIKHITERLDKLEAQANHFGDINKMVPPPVARVTRDRDETGNYVIVHDTATPPPVATDEELRGILRGIWDRAYDLGQALRAIYDLGIKHGQAGSREVAEPAPVAGGLVARVKTAIDSVSFDEEARAAILEVATWLYERSWNLPADLLEQEAGR
jgi:hypothetical protein